MALEYSNFPLLGAYEIRGNAESRFSIRSGRRFTILLLLAFAISPVSALSQKVSVRSSPIKVKLVNASEIQFTRLTTRDGLSHSRVTQILQDDQGFMWFGTEDGLDRYDGYSFKVFRPGLTPNGLSGADIRALFKDRSGRLWIGVDGVLDRFDPATENFTHYRIDDSSPASRGAVISSLCQDRAGMLWVTTNRGLYKLDPATAQIKRYAHNPNDAASINSDDLTFVMEDSRGLLWIISATGLDAMDPKTSRVSHYLSFQREEVENTIWPGTKLYEDRSGVLWMISTSGDGLVAFDRSSRKLVRYSFHKREPDPLSQVGLMALLEDRDGIFWLATVGSGLIRFDRTHNTFVQYRNKLGTPTSLPNNFLLSLFEDREGNIWAGTGGGGVVHFPGRPSPFQIYRKEPGIRNSLDQNYVLSVFEDSNGIVWIGNDSVLNRLDRKAGRYSFYRNDPDDPHSISSGSVTSTVEDQSGHLWFGTYGGGLDRFDPRTGRFERYRNNPADSRSLSSDRVLSLFIDHAATLWIGTGDGLNRFDPKSEDFTIFRQNPSSALIQITEDLDHRLWLGSLDRGLNRFDPETGRFTAYLHDQNNPTSLSSDRVNALCMDKSGTLWVGTQNGLDRFDPKTGTFQAAYFQEDGLPNNAIQGVHQDAKGRLWISTDNGISRFNPQTNEFRNYYESDGLAGNDFGVFFPVSFMSPTGELFFGGVDGITAFHPDELDKSNNPYIPPVVLTDFRLSNNPVAIGSKSVLKKAISYDDSLTLSHTQNIFSIEFSALSYFSPTRNRYRYKLEGLERNWNEVGSDRRLVTYTTLPPGRYTFRVQGSNNLGVWNTEGASIRILILPPWWDAWWFRATCAAAVLLLTYVAYQYRVRQLVRYFEVRLQERTRIAQELHDTFLQTVQGSKLVADDALEEPRDPARMHQAMKQLSDWLGRATQEGRAALNSLRTSATQRNDLAEALQGAIADCRIQSSMEASLNVEGVPKDMHPIVRDEIYRIGYEAIRNACTHSRGTRLEVGLRYAQNLTIRVRDNGIGIDPAIAEKGRDGHFGLQGMRERAARIGSKLTVSSAGTGTEIIVIVPGRIVFRSRS
jgi:ligand-binding sensor domain-containing protein